MPASVERDQPLHERGAFGILARALVVLARADERVVQAGDQSDRVAGVVQRLSARVDPGRKPCIAVRAAVAGVVEQDDPAPGDDGGPARLYQTGVEGAWPPRAYAHRAPPALLPTH